MKKNLYIMYAISLLQGMVFYGPIATLYRQAQGVTVFQITLIESISLALTIALEIPWGVAADKLGYRKTMVFCSGLYFISKIVFWQAASFWGFLLERIMLSVVISGFSGVDVTILYLSSEGGDSQKVFGIYNSANMAGLLFAAAVFSLFVKDNYALSALLTVVSYGAAAMLSLCLSDVKPEPQSAPRPEPIRETLVKTLSNKTFLLFLIAVALLTEAHQTITVFLSQLQYTRCGLSASAMGMVYIAVTLLGLLGVYSSGLTRRLGAGPSLFLFCALDVAACLVLALSSRAVPSVMSILAMRLSYTLLQPYQAEIQNRQIHTGNRATALSVYSMLISTVGIVTNLIFGALSDRSLSAAFFFGGAICALSLLLFFVWHGKTQPSRVNRD